LTTGKTDCAKWGVNPTGYSSAGIVTGTYKSDDYAVSGTQGNLRHVVISLVGQAQNTVSGRGLPSRPQTTQEQVDA